MIPVRHPHWPLAGMLVGFLLATAVAQATHGHWMDHYRNAKGFPCCSKKDCVVVQARLLPHAGPEAALEINGVPIRLDFGSVHVSEDTSSHWCAKDPDEPISTENTYCVFLAVGS